MALTAPRPAGLGMDGGAGGVGRATGGCGLGLAIVYSIAQAMGGTVHCEESELGGARFCFSWPVYHNIALPVPA